jgi:hypothetical protein
MGILKFALTILLVAVASLRDACHGTDLKLNARSQVSLVNPGQLGDYPFLNLFKLATQWSYNDAGALLPTDVDENGNPLPTSPAFSGHGGARTWFNTPNQYERPGHYVLAWTGGFKALLGYNYQGSLKFVSCIGGNGSQAGNHVVCDNTKCSPFIGSISGTTLTVTSVPKGTGCRLGENTPITWGANGGFSKFGTPTIVTSAGSSCGSNRCYTVNQPQTVDSTTMYLGARLEWSVGIPETASTFDLYTLNVQAAANLGSTNFALYHVSDESLWVNSAIPCGSGQACIVGTLFKTRIQQANFKVLRDLDWTAGNGSNCATWASRKPIYYYSYATSEIPNDPSSPRQYINSVGTGRSGGTIAYNAETDVYSIALGSGGPVDKQTIHVLFPSTGTVRSKISLNGTMAVPILTSYGATPSGGPSAESVYTLFFDAAINGWLLNGAGFNCYVPPEVFVEINAELQTTPWHVMPFYALDPMTDWVKSYATYLLKSYPGVKPIFETTNEPWNFSSPVCGYLSIKSAVWIARDPAWKNGFHCGGTGDIYGEAGKMLSTAGQDLNVILGAGNYELLAPVQTGYGGAGIADNILQTPGYVNQTLIPAQGGYRKAPAYEYATRISVNNYLNTGYYQQTPEVLYAFCYVNYAVALSCQSKFSSQAAVMTAYMNSTFTSSLQDFNLPKLNFYLNQWSKWAATCSYRSRPSSCTLNSTAPLMMYEGGYNEANQSYGPSQPISSATNARSAVLSVAGNSCHPGIQINLLDMSGGTWGNRNGTYAVIAATSSTCTINLDSIDLGKFSSGKIQYSNDTTQFLTGATNSTTAILAAPSNGCIGGQTVALTGLSGGSWSTVAGNYTVQSSGTDSGHCAINLNSSDLSTFGASAAATAKSGQFSGTVSIASCPIITPGPFTVWNGTTGRVVGTGTMCRNGSISVLPYVLNPVTSGDTLRVYPMLTHVGSTTQINTLRQHSYLAPELDSITTALYGAVVSNGGVNPSQYQMSSGGSSLHGNPWEVLAFDIYGFYPTGQCSGCTISGTTLTLGGHIIGMFRKGDALLASGAITGIGTGAESNTILGICTPIGPNACGTTAGDTFKLNQSSTFASPTGMLSAAMPPTGANGTGTTSPIRAWGAICRWNSNSAACNGDP